MSQDIIQVEDINVHVPYGLVPIERNLLLPNIHVEQLTSKLFASYQEDFVDYLDNIKKSSVDLQLKEFDCKVFEHCLENKHFYINGTAQKCIFIDRDNCINDDYKGYQADYSSIKIFPNAYKVLAKLKKMGYLVILVSNQSGIDRGYFTYEEFVKCMNDFAQDAYNTSGFIFDAVVFTTSPDLSCDIRKPNLGGYQLVSKYFQIDLSKSLMIGDSPCDQEFAQNLGIKFVSVLTGRTRIYDADLVIGSIESLMHPEDYPIFS